MPYTPKILFKDEPILGITQVRSNISNKALTSNLATLTTSAAHGITQVGTIVLIRGVDSVFDGIYAIHSIPTTTTFTYVKTNANITSAAVSPVGSAVFNTSVNSGFTVTNKVVQNNTATLTTSSAHGLAVGDLVMVTIGDTVYDVIGAQVFAVPTTTTFSYAVSTATAATTAVSQGAYCKLPALYTTPASTTTVITSVVVSNTGSTARTFTLNFDNTALAHDASIAANSTATFDLKQVLPTTKTIVGIASHQAVEFLISGMEIS